MTDLHVFLRAELKEALDPRTGMLGSLPFVTMRKQKNNPAHTLPLGFCTGNELIDHHLGAISKVAELCLPVAKHLRIVERIAIVESEDSRFAKQRIVNAAIRAPFLRESF